MRLFTKRAIAIILALIFCIGCLTACSNNSTNDNDNSSSIATGDESISETIAPTDNESTADNNSQINETTDSPTNTENSETLQATEEPETNKPTETTKNESQVNNCSHDTAKIINKANATCTKAGYTGDTYCTKCNITVSKGSQIKATGHKNTELKNYKDATTSSEGYTGDTYCTACNTKISSGKATPKIVDDTAGKTCYYLPDGTTIYADNDTEARKLTMAKATKSASHQFPELEQEILRLVNIERANAGLQPLSWYEDAYYFTKTRAEECLISFGHKRPDGRKWITVYTDANVLAYGFSGENLLHFEGYSPENLASTMVESWMNSPRHKENILNSNYKQISIAVIRDGISTVAVQHFFG